MVPYIEVISAAVFLVLLIMVAVAVNNRRRVAHERALVEAAKEGHLDWLLRAGDNNPNISEDGSIVQQQSASVSGSLKPVEPDPIELQPQRFVVTRRPSSDGPKGQMSRRLACLNEVILAISAQEAKQIVANRITVGTCHLTAQLQPA